VPEERRKSFPPCRYLSMGALSAILLKSCAVGVKLAVVSRPSPRSRRIRPFQADDSNAVRSSRSSPGSENGIRMDLIGRVEKSVSNFGWHSISSRLGRNNSGTGAGFCVFMHSVVKGNWHIVNVDWNERSGRIASKWAMSLFNLDSLNETSTNVEEYIWPSNCRSKSSSLIQNKLTRAFPPLKWTLSSLF
jgi:hypothetical protein